MARPVVADGLAEAAPPPTRLTATTAASTPRQRATGDSAKWRATAAYPIYPGKDSHRE